MKIHCKYDSLLELDKINPHPKNPNKHDDTQIDRLCELYKYHGIRHPIIISSFSNCIVAGHGRLMAAKKIKMDNFPVVYQGFDNEEAEYAFLTADNAIANWAELDLSAINTEIQNLGPDFNIDWLGIKDFKIEVADKLEPGCDEDAIPEKVDPKTKPGDIYQLGNHRLMCGDSTSIDAVEKLMNGENADICFTSPPYNAAKGSFLNGRVSGFDDKYSGNADAMDDSEYRDFLSGFTSIALEKCRFVFVNLQLLSRNRLPLVEYQYTFRETIKDILIWNKTLCPPNIVKGAFNTKFEFVFCFSKENDTRGFPCSWQGKYPNVVETESNSGNEFADQHKAGFPVAFPLWFLEKLDFAKTIYDPFGGTGTTIIACEKTNRKCFMMELDAHYCDVIVARWEKYTGKQAVLL